MLGSQLVLNSKSIPLAVTLILLLASPTAQKCGVGCLQCTALDECLYCNVFLGYFADSNKKCFKKELKNCTQPNIQGRCVICAENYYLETISGECKEMPNMNRIAKCLLYADLFNCSLCEEFHYVSEKQCVAVTDNILNCKLYKEGDSKVCLQCKEGYIASFDGGECHQITPIASCASYSIQKCLECKSGSQLNESSYLGLPQQFHIENAANQFITYLAQLQFGIRDYFSFSQCERFSMSNCVRAKSVFECEVCETDYYLSLDKQCFKNPSEAIDFCSVYLTQSVCLECQQGFYPENPHKCTQIPKIDHCEVYSQTASKCSVCESTFFLNGDVCQKRIISLQTALCVERNPTADSCKTCRTGFHVTNDGLKCLAALPNCKSYKALNKDSPVALCHECATGFYLDEAKNTCFFPTITDSGCEIYARTSTKCDKCKDGFYRDSQQNCLKHNLSLISSDCQKQSSDTANACGECKQGFTLFKSDTTCQQVTNPISNCQDYKSQSSCLKCDQGFYAPQCNAIPGSANCLEYNYLLTTCKICKADYLLDTNGACVKPDASFLTSCEKVKIKNDSTFECEACKKGYFFFNWKDRDICSETENSIDNCQAYTGTGPTLKCVRCDSAFVLDKVLNKCVPTCPTEKPLLLKQELNGSKTVVHVNVCTDAKAGCRIEAIPHYDENDGSHPASCVECEANYFRYLDLKTADKHLTFHTFNGQNLYNSLDLSVTLRNNFYSCVLRTDLVTKNKTPKATPSTGCELYAKKDDFYYCVKCQHGYSGPVKNFGTSASPLYGIDECSVLKECVAVINDYSGLSWAPESSKLNFALNTLMTCASCNGTKIPFLHISSSSETKLGKYDTISNIPVGGTETGLSVECRDPTQGASFGVTNSPFSVTNCSAGVWDLDDNKTTKADFAVCVACKPGFKPVFQTSGKLYSVTSCQKIANCDSLKGGKWFSSCSQCSLGSTWTYKVNGSVKYIDYSVCTIILSNDFNCGIVDINGVCASCHIGYQFNEDGICENIRPGGCENNFNFEWKLTGANTMPPYLGTMYEPRGNGCTSCTKPAKAHLITTDDYSCTYSEYVSGDTFKGGTKFIPNCVNYSYNYTGKTHTCKLCKSDKRLNASGTKCIPKTNRIGCQIFSDNETDCNVCENGYSKSDKICLLNNISNCIEYFVENGGVKCSRCKDENYLVSNECKTGSVPNCKEYYTNGDPFACKTCVDTYALFNTKKNKSICLKMDVGGLRNYCNKWQTFIHPSAMTCSECQQGYILVQNKTLLDFANNVCLGPTTLSNCILYDIQAEPRNSTYDCLECQDGYYVNNGLCTKRSFIQNCVKFEIKDDLCVTCAKGFFISSDKKSCLAYPTGIQGCKQYLSDTLCGQCKAGFYLKESRCQEVETAKIVKFCEDYTETQTCKKCQENFLLIQSRCEAVTIVGCAEYQNLDNCKLCKPTYGLKMKDGKAKCVVKEVPFCSESENFYPFRCKVCQTKYYPKNGICTPVKQNIDYCLIYDSPDTCRFCDSSSTQSFDGKSCMLNDRFLKSVDINCLYNSIVKPICNTCEEGFYLEHNQCKQCGIGVDKGCSYCNPTNPKACLLCKAKYNFVTSTKTCEVEVIDDGEETISVGIWRGLVWLTVLSSLIMVDL